MDSRIYNLKGMLDSIKIDVDFNANNDSSAQRIACEKISDLITESDSINIQSADFTLVDMGHTSILWAWSWSSTNQSSKDITSAIREEIFESNFAGAM